MAFGPHTWLVWIALLVFGICLSVDKVLGNSKFARFDAVGGAV